MPIVKFSNKTKIRTIKNSFIWLDYAVLLKGNPANFLLTIKSNMSNDVRSYALSHFSTRDRSKRPMFDFKEASESALINIPNSSKYSLEIIHANTNNEVYEINLYYK